MSFADELEKLNKLKENGTLSEPEYQIDQPPHKGNQGNDSPKRFLPDGTEILSQNVDDCQYREQVKNDTYFNPYHYR
jgi:hypothetical protein